MNKINYFYISNNSEHIAILIEKGFFTQDSFDKITYANKSIHNIAIANDMIDTIIVDIAMKNPIVDSRIEMYDDIFGYYYNEYLYKDTSIFDIYKPIAMALVYNDNYCNLISIINTPDRGYIPIFTLEGGFPFLQHTMYNEFVANFNSFDTDETPFSLTRFMIDKSNIQDSIYINTDVIGKTDSIIYLKDYSLTYSSKRHYNRLKKLDITIGIHRSDEIRDVLTDSSVMQDSMYHHLSKLITEDLDYSIASNNSSYEFGKRYGIKMLENITEGTFICYKDTNNKVIALTVLVPYADNDDISIYWYNTFIADILRDMDIKMNATKAFVCDVITMCKDIYPDINKLNLGYSFYTYKDSFTDIKENYKGIDVCRMY